jgi:hypothetical protein
MTLFAVTGYVILLSDTTLLQYLCISYLGIFFMLGGIFPCYGIFPLVTSY